MEESKNVEVEKILEIFGNNYNGQVILYGPPGTSKTYSAKIIAANLIKDKEPNELITKIEDAEKILKENKEKFMLVQFHPSYNYEDFVRG